MPISILLVLVTAVIYLTCNFACYIKLGTKCQQIFCILICIYTRVFEQRKEGTVLVGYFFAGWGKGLGDNDLSAGETPAKSLLP